MSYQGRGHIYMNTRMLADLLRLPPGVSVTGARWEFDANVIRFYLRGDGLPVVMEGELSPRVDPIFKNDRIVGFDFGPQT